MSNDELIRAICYGLMAPSFAFFAMIEYNRRRYSLVIVNQLLAIFFFILLVGLVTRHYYATIPELLLINTGVVIIMATVVAYRTLVLLLGNILDEKAHEWLRRERRWHE